MEQFKTPNLFIIVTALAQTKVEILLGRNRFFVREKERLPKLRKEFLF